MCSNTFHSPTKPISRAQRVTESAENIYGELNAKQREFVEFLLGKYIESGVGELDQEKLPDLLQLKYQALPNAVAIFGSTDNILSTFIGFQRHLYDRPAT
ncbi:MAG: hypothetical protein HGA97_12870 [Chlorobiaceae bacterium]|jgi:type I restriction enzyme, R subunit|nr:hypothetical protein [Chlorobiaceae bacterium]